MSDFLKKLKSVFVVETAPSEEPASEPRATAEVSKTISTQPIATPIVPKGTISDKFTEILFQAMEAANQEGFDYVEYKRSLQTLEKMPMDEKTRYFSAFAAAQSMGITKDKLLGSADFYLSVLKNENLKFQEATKGQREKQIGGKEKVIENLAATIQAKGEQIARLTEEIQKHQAEMDALKTEIADSVVKIETTMNDFTASYTNLAQQIEADKTKMQQFLQ